MGHKGQVLAIQKNAHSLPWVEIGAMGLPFLESPSNSASPWCAPFFFELPQLLCNDFAQCGGGDFAPKGAVQAELLLGTNTTSQRAVQPELLQQCCEGWKGQFRLNYLSLVHNNPLLWANGGQFRLNCPFQCRGHCGSSSGRTAVCMWGCVGPQEQFSLNCSIGCRITPHTVQSHCTATVATQRKMGHTMEMQNLMEIPKMAAPLPQSRPKTSCVHFLNKKQLPLVPHVLLVCPPLHPSR